MDKDSTPKNFDDYGIWVASKFYDVKSPTEKKIQEEKKVTGKSSKRLNLSLRSSVVKNSGRSYGETSDIRENNHK